MTTVVNGGRVGGWALLILLGASGCSSRESAPVNGKITINGQPAADIGVSFEPVGKDAGLGSFGKTDAAGSYTLRFVDNDREGALVGPHAVRFSDLQNAAKTEDADAGDLPPQISRIPARYQTEIQTFEVKPGNNQADFDLQ